MAKWNTFQKDLLFITFLAILHLVFTAVSPFKGAFSGGEVLISRELATFTFESVSSGETVTYTPILTGLYVILLIGLIIKKPRSQTLIYGLGLVLVTKFSFLSQLSNLEGTVTDIEATGLISMTIRTSGDIVVQDLAGYVLLALFLIKLTIVTHTLYMKRKKTHAHQTVPIQSKNEVPN